MDESELTVELLEKLYRKTCWGKGHMLVKNLQSVAPTHMRGYVKDALKKLVNLGLIIVYGRTKHGLAVHLNTAKKKEIEKILFGTAANQNA